MIEFEARSQREKDMVAAVARVLADLDLTGGARKGGSPGIMAKFMQSDAAQYMDLIMAPNSLLPVRLDAMRQYVMYANDDPARGPSIAQSTARRQPVKYALTAMGLAAISSGEGGREQAMQKWLPEIMQGRLFCYCITEPDAGTNTNRIATTAVDEGDHFRINGQKTFISAADTAHYMVVIAKVIEAGKEAGVGTFIFPAKTDGISMTELDIAVLGDRQFTIYFDDVRVAKDALVGAKSATKGGKISASVFYTLNLERIIVGFTTLRICQEALAKAVKLAKAEPMSGPPPGARRDIKKRLAAVKLKLELANLATQQATLAYDNNENPVLMGTYANMAKYLSTQAANEACELALSLYGVEGLDKEADDIGGIYQMARLLRVAPINNEMVLNFLGEHMLGLPKSYR